MCLVYSCRALGALHTLLVYAEGAITPHLPSLIPVLALVCAEADVAKISAAQSAAAQEEDGGSEGKDDGGAERGVNHSFGFNIEGIERHLGVVGGDRDDALVAARAFSCAQFLGRHADTDTVLRLALARVGADGGRGGGGGGGREEVEDRGK